MPAAARPTRIPKPGPRSNVAQAAMPVRCNPVLAPAAPAAPKIVQGKGEAVPGEPERRLPNLPDYQTMYFALHAAIEELAPEALKTFHEDALDDVRDRFWSRGTDTPMLEFYTSYMVGVKVVQRWRDGRGEDEVITPQRCSERTWGKAFDKLVEKLESGVHLAGVIGQVQPDHESVADMKGLIEDDMLKAVDEVNVGCQHAGKGKK